MAPDFYPLLRMPYTYILFSQKLNKYYIGSSIDKDARLVRHNNKTEKFTSLGVPWTMVYFEEFSELRDARKRELEIKRKKSRKYIEWLIERG
jgi:putative endonuclease